ncbi:MAG: hypothetical protein AAGI34_00775 [Pseudomonadota bacterium]
MSFLRPQALALLLRYAEAALTGLGALWLALLAFDWLTRAPLVGVALGLLSVGGAFWSLTALRRAAMAGATSAAAEHAGPGVVEIAEARIGYFGPDGGGWVALDDLVAVAALADGQGGLVSWEFLTGEGDRLSIPGGARNAMALPDTLAALPGFDTGAAARALTGERVGLRVLWRRSGRGPVLLG